MSGISLAIRPKLQGREVNLSECRTWRGHNGPDTIDNGDELARKISATLWLNSDEDGADVGR